MPKKAKNTELSPAQKALSAAKVALENAQKADTAKSTDATKAAVAAAEKAVSDATGPVKREAFVRVAGGRVKKARIAIRNLGNVNSLRTYSYTQADIDTAEKGLLDAWNTAKAKMVAGLATKASASAPKDEFTF